MRHGGSESRADRAGPVRRHVGILRHAPYRPGGSALSSFEEAWKNLPEANIVGVRIGLMSNEEIRKEGGNREVTSHSYGDKSKTDTIYDPRMGPTSLTVKCDTNTKLIFCCSSWQS